jgi:CRP-like cAMP-binding protein
MSDYPTNEMLLIFDKVRSSAIQGALHRMMDTDAKIPLSWYKPVFMHSLIKEESNPEEPEMSEKEIVTNPLKMSKEQLFEAVIEVGKKRKEHMSDYDRTVMQRIIGICCREFIIARNSPKFMQMGDKEYWVPLVDCFNYIKTQPGDFLYHHNDNADCMYILLSGKAARYLPNEYCPTTTAAKIFELTSIATTFDKIFWSDFILAIGNPKLEKHSEWLYEAFNDGTIKAVELFLLNSPRVDSYIEGRSLKYQFTNYVIPGQVLSEGEMRAGGSIMGTVVSVESCLWAVLKRDRYDYFMSGMAIQERRNREILKHSLQLSRDLTNRIAPLFLVSEHRLGHVVYRQNEPITHVYLITEGSVQVVDGVI